MPDIIIKPMTVKSNKIFYIEDKMFAFAILVGCEIWWIEL